MWYWYLHHFIFTMRAVFYSTPNPLMVHTAYSLTLTPVHPYWTCWLIHKFCHKQATLAVVLTQPPWDTHLPKLKPSYWRNSRHNLCDAIVSLLKIELSSLPKKKKKKKKLKISTSKYTNRNGAPYTKLAILERFLLLMTTASNLQGISNKAAKIL